MTANLSEHDPSPRYWVVIPAAGVGSRMQAEIPKQYLTLVGQTIIEHTLERLASHPAINGIVVAIAEHDDFWGEAFHTRFLQHLRIPTETVIGGQERFQSVNNALSALLSGQLSLQGQPDDWVLVHDAARPCVTTDDIEFLINSLADDAVGGLLGIPVADTLKRLDDHQRVQQTVSRYRLWRALTPQMFRLGLLSEALSRVNTGGAMVTDDASAMELAGHSPRMICGNEQNIKITRPQDLQLASLYLEQQGHRR